MSQPKQYKDNESDPLDVPIAAHANLIQFFVNAQKNRQNFLVGVEHEKFAFALNNAQPLAYEKNPGIQLFLQTMLKEEQAIDESKMAILEDGNLIGIHHGRSSVTLEPGGQVELSGVPFSSIHDVDTEISLYEEMTNRIAGQLGIGFLSLGYHPTASRRDISWMPKNRYAIMRGYMPKVGTRGLDMMLRTCTVQANLDYEDEKDMVLSVKTALAISPIVTALFANSPFAEGKPTGFLSERTMVWQDTDPARCGFPAVALQDDFGFEKWIDYVLDVPMYLIRRQGQYIDMTGISFREFMKNGAKSQVATLRDFADHLTTIFTEVRIKPQIELRSADVGPSPYLRALPAFWKGILYVPSLREKAYELMEKPNAEELKLLQVDAARRGFQATYRGKTILGLAEQLLELSRSGLNFLQNKSHQEKEADYLAPLFQSVERRETLAEKLLHLYRTKWQGDVSQIFVQ